MKTNKIIFLAILIITTMSCDNKVSLSLPSIFSDQMILQRETEVSFWGKSSPKENIKITCCVSIFFYNKFAIFKNIIKDPIHPVN